MATAPQVTGPCTVSVNTGAAGVLATLGVSRAGIKPRRTRITIPIPCDINGGEEGVPIDIQDLGGFDRVHIEFSKWDSAVAANVRTSGNPITATGGGFASMTLGTIPTIGALIIANLAYYRLLLNPTNGTFPMNFLCAIPIDDPYEIDLRAQFSVLSTDWICYPLSGVIWNTTTT